MKFYMVVNYYVVSLNFKFYENPCTNAPRMYIIITLYTLHVEQVDHCQTSEDSLGTVGKHGFVTD